MSTGSSEDQRRRLADELEEGEFVPSEYHSSSDTEDYCNRDAAFSGESDETITDLDATASSTAAYRNRKGNVNAPSHNLDASASSAATNHDRKDNARASYSAAKHNRKSNASASSAAASHNRKGNASASSAAATYNRKGNAIAPSATASQNFKGKASASPAAASHNPKGKASASSAAASHNRKGNASESSVAANHNPKDNASESYVAVNHDRNGNARTSSNAANHDRKGNASATSAAANHMAEARANANLVPSTEPVVHQQPAPPPAGKKARLVRRKRQNPDGPDPMCRIWSFSTYQAFGGHMSIHQKGDPIALKKKKKKKLLIQPLPPPADPHVADHTLALPIKAESQSLAPLMDAVQPATAAVVEGTPEPEAGQRATGRVILFGVDIGLRVRTPPAEEGSAAAKDEALTLDWESQSLAPSVDAAQPPTATVAADTPEPEAVPRATGRVILFGVDIGLGVRTPPAQEGSPVTKDAALTMDGESQSLAPAMDAAQPATVAVAEGTPEPEAGPRATGRVILFGVDIGLGVRTPPAQEGSPATKDASASTGGKQQ